MKAGSIVVLVLSLTWAAFAAKKPKAAPPPVQQDIAEACVVVQGISFHPATFMHPADVQVYGTIVSRCAREVTVRIHVQFFDASGVGQQDKQVQQLVSPGGATEFHLAAEFYGKPYPQSSQIKTGRVVDVTVIEPGGRMLRSNER